MLLLATLHPEPACPVCRRQRCSKVAGCAGTAAPSALHPRCLTAAHPPSAAADKGRQRRERLDWPEATDPAADHWQSGSAWQITRLEHVPVQGLRGGAGGAQAAASKPGGSGGSRG